MRHLTIEHRPVDGPIQCARNSRTHSDAQVAQIADNKLALNAGWDDAMLQIEPPATGRAP